MEEEGIQRAHTHHVIVEGAARDGLASLTGQHHVRGGMAAHDGLARLAGLAGGEGAIPRLERVAAPDEQVHALAAVVGAQADMVGRALIGQMADRRQGRMDGEMARVGEEGGQRPLRLLVFKAAVQVGDQIGGREMHAAILAVCTGGHGRGIGRPHGRGRTGGGGKARRVLPCPLQHLRVVTCKAQRAQEGDVRAFMRGQDELRQAEVGQPLHLVQPLQDCGTRRRSLRLVQAGRQIARRQTRIGVRRPDQSIGIGFDRVWTHYIKPLISPVMFLTPSASKLATG